MIWSEILKKENEKTKIKRSRSHTSWRRWSCIIFYILHENNATKTKVMSSRISTRPKKCLFVVTRPTLKNLFQPTRQFFQDGYDYLQLKGHWTSITSIVLYLGWSIKPIPKFSADSANAFTFYEFFFFFFCIIFRVSHRLTEVCIYCSRLWKIENARNIQISSKVSQTACSHYPCQHF